MKNVIASLISNYYNLSLEEIYSSIEIPPNFELGDYSFPCFSLAKKLKKSPVEISKELSSNLKSDKFEKIESKGPYLNFFQNRYEFALDTLKKIMKEKKKYGSNKTGTGKTIVIDMSSPNIAKPFGIGHLRSTIIGNSISEMSKFSGFKTIKINYFGDWGTPFGKLIAGFRKFGSEKKLKTEPIKHLYEIYVKVSADKNFEEIGRNEFVKLENGDKDSIKLWSKFKKESINDFNKIYSLLGVKFDVNSCESFYNDKMESVVQKIKSKGLLKESEGAQIVDLESEGLGVVLIKKADGTTLYATRDLAAAIHRKEKYKADYLLYEVGAEQKLHFKQVFKILNLIGYSWANNCIHIDHGFYLDKEGKKFATRKGKTIFMQDVLDETISLAREEISKREKLSSKDLQKRALAIARAAIIYGDLKNYRSQDMTFDLQRFLDFEGNTGPYLLYTYARANSILSKSTSSSKGVKTDLTEQEKNIISNLSKFPETVIQAQKTYSPNIISNYAYSISKEFNEYYHSTKVIGSSQEKIRSNLVRSFSIVLENALSLLGVQAIKKM